MKCSWYVWWKWNISYVFLCSQGSNGSTGDAGTKGDKGSQGLIVSKNLACFKVTDL